MKKTKFHYVVLMCRRSDNNPLVWDWVLPTEAYKTLLAASSQRDCLQQKAQEENKPELVFQVQIVSYYDE